MMLPFACYLFDNNLSLADVDSVRAHHEQLTNQELFHSVVYNPSNKFPQFVTKTVQQAYISFKETEFFQSTQVKNLSN